MILLIFFISDKGTTSIDNLVRWMSSHALLTKMLDLVIYSAFKFDIKVDSVITYHHYHYHFLITVIVLILSLLSFHLITVILHLITIITVIILARFSRCELYSMDDSVVRGLSADPTYGSYVIFTELSRSYGISSPVEKSVQHVRFRLFSFSVSMFPPF